MSSLRVIAHWTGSVLGAGATLAALYLLAKSKITLETTQLVIWLSLACIVLNMGALIYNSAHRPAVRRFNGR